MEPFQNGQSTVRGAKRRKTGIVTRFTPNAESSINPERPSGASVVTDREAVPMNLNSVEQILHPTPSSSIAAVEVIVSSHRQKPDRGVKVTVRPRQSFFDRLAARKQQAIEVDKIIEPIGHSTGVSGGGLMVTFKALRSDGTIASVNDKYLKSTNPQLLINFYEQYLR